MFYLLSFVQPAQNLFLDVQAVLPVGCAGLCNGCCSCACTVCAGGAAAPNLFSHPWMHRLLHKRLCFSQKLPGQNDNGSRPITNLGTGRHPITKTYVSKHDKLDHHVWIRHLGQILQADIGQVYFPSLADMFGLGWWCTRAHCRSGKGCQRAC